MPTSLRENPDGYTRTSELPALYGISKAWVYKRAADPDDPLPPLYDLGPNASGSRNSEILAYLDSRQLIADRPGAKFIAA